MGLRPSEPSVEPPDVLLAVQATTAHLDGVRAGMGREAATGSPLRVHGAQPREVYSQARALHHKVERLCREQGLSQVPCPDRPQRVPQPRDVLALVEHLTPMVTAVGAQLEATVHPVPAPRDDRATPSHVCRALLQLNRQANLLLNVPYSPCEVQEQVALALAYVERLLRVFPTRSVFPRRASVSPDIDAPAVHARLVDCFERIGVIARRSGHSVISLRVNRITALRVDPGDTYDMAGLLVDELHHLHLTRGDLAPPVALPVGPDRGHSDVFRAAGMLLQRLAALDEATLNRPDWLVR